MVLSASRVICLPGAARRLITFLASPRKVNQRRRPPSTAPTGYPALLVKPGGCATRALRSDSARRLLPACLCCSAVDRGEFGACDAFPVLSLTVEPPPNFPSAPLRIDRRIGGVSAAPCLSASARVAQTPNSPVNPKEPVGRRGGAAFLWLLFFGRTKKVTRCRAAPALNQACAKRIPILRRTAAPAPDPDPPHA